MVRQALARLTAAVSEVLAGIKRWKGTAPEGKSPLLTDDVHRLVRAFRRRRAGGAAA